jgi:3-isopropylmalate/(R)-2-methylmalate dehydratase small subunit
MQAFTKHSGIAAPLLQPNIDTDAIIPSREMKLVSKQGLGEGLFASWRYSLPGGREPNKVFILNQPDYRACSIILAGSNFGCGSSREHAVWALAEFGIRCVVAPSFGSIFFNNCIANGLLPIVLAESTIEKIAKWVSIAPQRNVIIVDLIKQELLWANHSESFAIDSSAKEMLSKGLDRIDVTLNRAKDIDQFEHLDRQRRPWVYLSALPKKYPASKEDINIS